MTRGLILAAVVLLGAGCARQDEILANAGKLGKLSSDARATVKGLALDVNQSCVRMVTLAKRFDSLVTFTMAAPSSGALTQSCKTRAALSAKIAANSTPVFDYLDAIAALGNYQPPTIDSSKAFEALGTNKNASNAYSQIAQFISESAGKRFRLNALRDTIPQQDANFQAAVADLQSAFAGSCSPSERGSYLTILAIEETYAQDTIFNLFLFTATPAKRPKPAAPVVHPCRKDGSALLIAGDTGAPSSPAPVAAPSFPTTLDVSAGAGMAPQSKTKSPELLALERIEKTQQNEARARQLDTFDKLNTELTSILAKTETQRQASLALAGALYNIAFAHEQLTRLLTNRLPPCGASAPPPTGAPAPKPTPKCENSTEIIARHDADEKIAFSAEAHLQAAIDQVREARQLLALD